MDLIAILVLFPSSSIVNVSNRSTFVIVLWLLLNLVLLLNTQKINVMFSPGLLMISSKVRHCIKFNLQHMPQLFIDSGICDVYFVNN